MDVFTQPFVLQLQPACPGQGVYLRWLSPLGNWEGWLFEGDTDHTTTPEAGSVFRPAGSAAQVLQRPGIQKHLLRAGNLLPGQWDGLSTLLTSPQVYVQDEAGTLTPVTVLAGPATRSSAETRTEFDVELDLGALNPLTRI
ncbi:hypothetical protein [Hymenobacter fodinae]|uniref:Uncharacterized protein n=1 Tax=Hymenobacter fodinae TaxID=2510796 RepID=A0A4Z0P171_9BACT|nr:hypothetical protein [Hymenobacter fodinae]TGE04773.1 hypothetical protein EU556_21570 [Hymenobacter fodinae]